jgi:hypothetical protein
MTDDRDDQRVYVQRVTESTRVHAPTPLQGRTELGMHQVITRMPDHTITAGAIPAAVVISNLF